LQPNDIEPVFEVVFTFVAFRVKIGVIAKTAWWLFARLLRCDGKFLKSVEEIFTLAS